LKRTYQEGRIPLRAEARGEFCYHSLYKDPHSLYHIAASTGKHPQHISSGQTLEIGDSLRISEAFQRRKLKLQFFL
jgi:hypothetical protein